MALQIWLPLIGDLTNNGLLGDLSFSTIGSPSWQNGGKIGKCIQIGNGSQITAGININSNLVNELGNEFSISVWVKPLGNHVHYNGTIISSGNWNTNLGRWAFGLSQDNSKVDVFSYNYNRYINCPVPVGEWTHLVSTQKNKICKLYKNGEYIGSYTAEYDCLYSNASNTTIGRETYANGYFSFNGCLNDLRIYDHELSLKEIEELSKGLLIHYKFDSQYEQSQTKNLIENLVAGGQTTITNETKITTSGVNKDTYFQFDITEPLEENMSYTIQCDVSSPLADDVKIWQFGVTGQSSGLNMSMYNGHNEFTWVCPSAASDKTRIMMDDNGNGQARANAAITEIYNFQIEKSDHAGLLLPFNSAYTNNQIEDSSGYLNNGIINGICDIVKDSPKFDNSAAFVSTGYNTSGKIYNYIYTPLELQNVTDITFAFWYKRSSSYNRGGFIALDTNAVFSNYTTAALNCFDSYADFYDINGTKIRISGFPAAFLSDSQWHYYILEYSAGNKAKLFRDNAEIKSVDAGAALKSFSYLGLNYSQAGGGKRGETCQFSDFRVYTTILKNTQKTELYNVSMCIDKNGNVYPRELVEK